MGFKVIVILKDTSVLEYENVACFSKMGDFYLITDMDAKKIIKLECVHVKDFDVQVIYF